MQTVCKLAAFGLLAPTSDARIVGHVSRAPLSTSEKEAVGEALAGAMDAIQHHSGGGKYQSCAKLFPNGVPDNDERNSATWQSCKDLIARASLVAKGSSLRKRGPLSDREKQAVGDALATAMGALKDHRSGSKYDSCQSLFPDGMNDDDPDDATWLSCKEFFVDSNGHSASLMAKHSAVSQAKKEPLSEADRQAVGNALASAMGAIKDHAGGGKYASCSSLYPNGTPDGDENTATWQSCKDIVSASLVAKRVTITRHGKDPLTSGEKEAVGNALADAMGALKNHAGGDKYDACVKLFPDGVNDDDPNSATWHSCKDVLAPVFGNKASLMSKNVTVSKKDTKPNFNESKYEEEWHKEYKTGDYPPEAEGKHHHPDYEFDAKKGDEHHEPAEDSDSAEAHSSGEHATEHDSHHSEEHTKSWAARFQASWLILIGAWASL